MQYLTDRYCLSCCSFAFWFRMNSSISFSTAAAIVSFCKITHLLENWKIFYLIITFSISIMNTFQNVQINFWFAIKFSKLHFKLTCRVFLYFKSFALWRVTVLYTYRTCVFGSLLRWKILNHAAMAFIATRVFLCLFTSSDALSNNFLHFWQDNVISIPNLVILFTL